MNSFPGWATFDYVFGSGNVHSCHGKTHINLYSWSAGLSTSLPTEFGEYYLGIGPSLCLINIKNTLCFSERVSKLSVGGVVKTGLLYNFSPQTFADIFIDYTYQPAHFERNVDVGGLRAGLGLGYNF